jgi:hypothetical protein
MNSDTTLELTMTVMQRCVPIVRHLVPDVIAARVDKETAVTVV